MKRRFLLALCAAGWVHRAHARAVVPRSLAFPRDHGSHPHFKTEWWYLTGYLETAGKPVGFQVTFFRNRTDSQAENPSAFAPKQILFAHAAIAHSSQAALLHAQRAARAGLGIAEAALETMNVQIRDWRLAREADAITTQIKASDFSLALKARAAQPLLLQGKDGLSRKGPAPSQASYYYSQPQLQVSAELKLRGQPIKGGGRAWLDHEWSEALLHPDAVGWDWVGMNFKDGAALTAFVLRRADGSALWAGGSFRTAGGALQTYTPQQVRFTPQRIWSSPATQARYPVAVQLDCPQGRFFTEPLLDNQELDSRSSVGTVYWEGLCELKNDAGRGVAWGYLEMTGYQSRINL